MKSRILKAAALGVFLSVVSLAITMSIPEPTAAQTPIGFFGPDVATGWQMLSSTSGTVLVATTTKIMLLACTNTTSGTVTLNVTDTAGDSIVSALPISGHGFQPVIDSVTGYVANGIKWWSGTASALSCYLGGKFQNP